MNSIQFKNKAFEITWQVLLALYCISVFVSKSGLAIFGILLIIISAFMLPWRRLWREEKSMMAFLALYPFAIICNLFSRGGAESALKVAYSWPWILLVLPAFIVAKRKSDQKVALISSCAALFVACLKSYYLFFTEYGGHFAADTRVASFWDISRWGLFLAAAMIGLMGLITYFDKLKNKKACYILLALFCASGISLFLSNTRGPWIAAVVGLAVIAALYPRILKYLVALGVIAAVSLSFSESFRTRLHSIVDVKKTESGKITSNDASNAGRLHMWQVAFEFYKEQPWFGTGLENTEIYLRDFLNRKGPAYIEKYVTSEFSYRDQHSSYLTTWVQMGIIFSVIFWSVFAWIFVGFAYDWFKTRSLWSASVLALMCAHLFLFIFYTSVQSYEMVALFPFMGIRQRWTLKDHSTKSV